MIQRKPKYSVVIPVYNRNEELTELLASLTFQEQKDFEVIVVDDGSSNRADAVVDKFRDELDINYYYKKNSGPGPSRNFGFDHAKGDYLVIFDSDCEVPPHYFTAVDQVLKDENPDVWGGPDKAKEDYSVLQKAISYAMTSRLTTGGIRGASKIKSNFQPRSFNMGMRKEAYIKSGGFKLNKLSEDIELSIRLKKEGFRILLIDQAYVYHKRRSSLLDFFQQVYRFGKGRAALIHLHTNAIKPAHVFPSVFLLGFIFLWFLKPPLIYAALDAYIIYALIILIDASIKNKSVLIGLLSLICSYTQLVGYGSGFISGLFSDPRKL
jgi:glycosyltransferase involved in cell wall biosynthesis